MVQVKIQEVLWGLGSWGRGGLGTLWKGGTGSAGAGGLEGGATGWINILVSY